MTLRRESKQSESKQYVYRVSPAEFARLEAILFHTDTFRLEIEKIRQKLGAPPGTEVRVQVIYD